MASKKKALIPDFNRDFVQPRELQVDNIGGVISRVKTMTADKVSPGAGKQTNDSFANFTARLGIQTGNMSSQAYYNLGPFITRNRIELEAAYRGNWMVGKIVDCIAEDMTRSGITMNSEMEPDDISELQVAISEFNIWHDLCNTIKWARLYGGCLAVMLIDGSDYNKPLNIESIGKDKFKGLVVLDRWMIQPSMGELITDLSKDIGKPKYYEAMPGVSVFPSMKIHHSRVLRFEGIELPYYQKLFENLWGLSVVERILDRLVAFDSATLGAAQLMYKAHLRVIKVAGFREALANGGKDEDAVVKQFMYIRAMQSNEGLTVLDAEDDFEVHPYAFAGVAEALQQFGQQISGGEDIPLVRLFGQSPAGFGNGVEDTRSYYDGIHKRQENEIRPNLEKLLAVMSMSTLEKPLPEDFEFKFVPLWQMSDKEKVEIAKSHLETIQASIGQGTPLISRKQGLQELKQESRITGIFTNISEEDIEDAEEEVPKPSIMPGEEKEPSSEDPQKKSPEEKQVEEPNERLGGANPEIKEEKTGDRMMFKDLVNKFIEKKDQIIRTIDSFMGDAFVEAEHPRGEGGHGGEFVKKGTGGQGSSGKEKEGTQKKEEKSEPTKEIQARVDKAIAEIKSKRPKDKKLKSLAEELNLNMIKGEFKKVKQNISEIKNYIEDLTGTNDSFLVSLDRTYRRRK